MATIQNARDTLLQAAGTRLGNVTLPSNVAVDFAYVTGTTKPSNNADVTTSILTNSGTSIVMNNANLFKSNSGAGGVFIGSGGLFGKDSGGVETFAIDASTGATRYKGDISGGSNINITGSARFRGSYTGSFGAAAVYANEAGGALNGVVGVSTAGAGIGVRGESTGTGVNVGIGVSGTSAGAGQGVSGYAASGTGVYGEGGGGGGYGVVGKGSAYGVYSDGPAYVSGNLTVTGTISGTVSYAATSGYAATAGEVSISSQANVTSTSGNAALRSVGTNYQAVQQTDGNFVVYNLGSPIGSATGGFPSDRRLKEDIAPTAIDGVSIIKRLRVVDYRWRENSPQRTHRPGLLTGFIAQEVAEIFAQAVSANRGQDGEAEPTLLLTPTDLIAPLTLVLQNVLTRLEALEATP